MSYPKNILRLRPTRGITIDVPAWEVGPDYYTGGSNVLFREGAALRTKGERSVYETVQDDVLNLINAQATGTNYWVYHGTDKSHSVDGGGTHTDITHASGLTAVTAAHQWHSTRLNGLVCSTNSLDAPMYWSGDTANNFVTLPNWPVGSSCKNLVAFQYHLFALDLSESGGEFPAKVMWSAAAEPGTVPATWVAAATNEAGDTELSGTPGALRTAVPLRGSLLIYKSGSVYSCDYVGGNSVFDFRPLFTNMGALTKRSVADINGQHFVVTDNDIVITDGANVRSVGTGRVSEYLFGQLAQDDYEMLFVAYNRAKHEVWVCYPTSGNSLCNEALIYDIAEDSWSAPRPLDGVSCGAVGIVDDAAPSNLYADATYTYDEANFTYANENYSLA
jgi:hypothetical protein